LAYHVGKQRQVNLGAKGNYNSYVKTYGLGLYRSRQYSIAISDDADLCLVSIEEDAEVMKV